MKLNKITKITAALVIAVFLMAGRSMAEWQSDQKIESDGHGGMTMEMSADDVMFLPGIGALVMADGKKLRIDFVASAENRDPAYRKVDIKQGDVLMMVNGQRVKTIKGLRELVEAIEVGAEIKFGIKRDKGMVMTSMAKADDSQMGGMVMQVVNEVDGGEEGQPGKRMTRTMSFGGGDESSVVPLMGLGIMLNDHEGQLVVGPKMQIQGMKPQESDLKPDDIVLAINDQPVKSAAEFSPIYDAIAGGEEVSLKLKRGDETLTVTFAKPNMGGHRVIRKSGK